MSSPLSPPADDHDPVHPPKVTLADQHPPMSPARSLLSLPADVLLEILGLLLVDTPRLPHRAAIVQTCKLLHELGIPLLYRVIDLIKSDVCLKGPSTQCRTLFGVGGVLSLSRREGSFVREIRVSAAQTYMAEFSGDRQHRQSPLLHRPSSP